MMNGELCSSKAIIIGAAEEGIEGNELSLVAPTFVFVEKPFKVSGTTAGGAQTVYIMLQQEAWGVNWFARDEKLTELTSDSEGKYETEIELEDIGFNKVYAAQKKEWLGLDWVKQDIKTPTKNILTLNYLIVGGVLILTLLILYKKGLFKRVFKKRGGKR